MIKKRKTLDLWRDYDGFIRSLHLKSVEEQGKDKKKRIINYVLKLFIIFCASFFTTLTFQFFINPNGLFNSGINGIIQALIDYLVKLNKISNENFPIFYYSSSLILNALIVFFLYFFFPKNLEMMSTSIFYVLFQLIWSNIFKYSSLKKYVFSRFAPGTWSNLSNRNQLGLTLPFYITIGIVSSIIHTYGYSLIYQTKSSPGGLDIIASVLSQNENKKNKKNSFSIGYLTKIFGIFVVFLITLFNFVFVEDNIKIKKNEVINIINSDSSIDEKINDKVFNNFLQKLARDNDLILNENESKILGIIKNWLNDDSLEIRDIAPHFEKKEKLLEYYLSKKNSCNEEKRGVDSPKSFDQKIKDLEFNIYEKNLLGYLKYITNDEKLWASLVYIFFSSYLINQIFPKNKLVYLTINVDNKDDLNNVFEILEDFNPKYFKVNCLNDSSKESYIVNCSITKWNYQLLSMELSEFGKILTNEIDESN
ncbi:MAG: hypothetical protein AD073_000207 [Mycoplasmataceae bacterium]|nr:MAG: hypothetical protein AD073_000207 [Mycoplasmataceae bacterium]